MPTRWFTASAWNKSRRSSVATLHRPARPERGMPAETAGSLHTGPPLQWLPPHRIGTSGVVQILAQHDQMRSVAEQGGPTGESPQVPASGGELVRDQGGEACPGGGVAWIRHRSLLHRVHRSVRIVLAEPVLQHGSDPRLLLDGQRKGGIVAEPAPV